MEIDAAENLADLNKKERHWIKTLKTRVPTGFNVDSGGSGPPKGMTFIYDGRTFRSAFSISRHYGVKYQTFCTRLREGATLREALGLGTELRDRDKPITVGGKSFPTHMSAARFHEINYGTFMGRLAAGETPEEAVGLTEVKKRRSRRYATLPFSERVHSTYKILPNGCWEWLERTQSNTGVPIATHNRKVWSARRLVYTVLVGPIKRKEMCIGTCGNRLCVNPAHATVGDHQVMHSTEAIKKNRKTGENHYQAKVTAKDATTIRGFMSRHEQYTGRPSPISFLARWYGLTNASVRDIWLRKTWKDV